MRMQCRDIRSLLFCTHQLKTLGASSSLDASLDDRENQQPILRLQVFIMQYSGQKVNNQRTKTSQVSVKEASLFQGNHKLHSHHRQQRQLNHRVNLALSIKLCFW